jgi:hypothetical protein
MMDVTSKNPERGTDSDKRSERQQYHDGDIVWDTHSKDVTPEMTAAVLKDQADRRKAFKAGLVKKAVQKRLNRRAD